MDLNSASVGDGSVPLKPPIAITASPLVASSVGAADCEPTVAAIHLYCPASCSSSLTSALLTWVLPDRPPIGTPPRPPVPRVPPVPVPGGPPWVPVPAPAPVPVPVRPAGPGKPPPGPPPGKPPPPPPGPPNPPATVGPALGIAPVCVVLAVSREYASGPPSPATSASASGRLAST